MKLVRFSTNEQSPRLGALRGDRIADLEASLAATLTRRGVVRAREIAAALVPQSTRGFLEGGAAAEEAVLSISEWVTVPAASARLHAPIADPGKFICIGLNYRDHAEETGNPIPKEPPIFAKWSNSIRDPGEPILRPRGSQQLDWEVELGVVIGRTARFVAREQALDYVWGYTIINDASARDFQFITSQWMAGKIFETAAPVGPYIADRKEITDPHALELRTWVNGKQMQSGNTKTFIFDVLSLDGLGGLPRPETGRSELETARLPNLAALAAESACGLIRHVAPGIMPGSGPGHLGLFGYDPLRYQVGRGVLEALGIEFDLRPGDVAARGNFCTVDSTGRITDRRAGRIPTEVCVRLTERLRGIPLPGVELFVEPVKEHRFVLVLRGRGKAVGLSGRLSETDPQALGRAPLPVKPLEPKAKASAQRVNAFVAGARRRLADAAPANMVLLRGFDRLPRLPRFPQVFGLRPAAIAAYPMYRGP